MNRILFSTGGLYNYGLTRIFDIAKLAGFDGLELIFDQKLDTQQPEYLNKLIKEYNLPILSIHVPWREIRGFAKTKIDNINKTIEIAEKIGAKIVVLHSLRNNPTWTNKIESELPKIQKKTSVIIAVENQTKQYIKKFYFFKKLRNNAFMPEHLRAFKNLCFCLSHVASTKIELLKFYNQIKSQIAHIHFSDDSCEIGDKHLLPGRGNLPLKNLLKCLCKDKYNGFITLEVIPDSYAKNKSDVEIVNYLTESIRFIKSGFGQ